MPTTSDEPKINYLIEKDIPISPVNRPGDLSARHQALRDMAVGDSIKIYGTLQISRARSCIYREQRDTNKQFTYRTIGTATYRIWRIK